VHANQDVKSNEPMGFSEGAWRTNGQRVKNDEEKPWRGQEDVGMV